MIISVWQLNSLITEYEKYKSSVLRMDLPAVGLYVGTSGFIFFRMDSPTSY